MNRWGLLLPLVALLGCSSAFESEAMKVRYSPPKGVKLLEEVAGPPRVARFSSGLEIRAVDGVPPSIDEAGLPALLAQIAPEVKGRVLSARIGTIGPERVARWTVKDSGAQSLVYYLPKASRYLVIRFAAPEASYAALENKIELSLASLRVGE